MLYEITVKNALGTTVLYTTSEMHPSSLIENGVLIVQARETDEDQANTHAISLKENYSVKIKEVKENDTL